MRLSEEKLVILNPASDAGAVGLHDRVHNLMVQIELHTKERGKGNHMFKRVGMLFLVFVLGTRGAFAQQETGQISGKVVDPNGAAVTKAAVTVKSVGTSAQRDTTTDDSGNYILTNLQPGLYDVTVKSSGFADHTQKAEITVGRGAWVCADARAAWHVKKTDR